MNDNLILIMLGILKKTEGKESYHLFSAHTRCEEGLKISLGTHTFLSYLKSISIMLLIYIVCFSS